MSKNLSLGLKLTLGMIGISLFIAILMSSLSYFSTKNTIVSDSKNSAISVVDNVKVSFSALYEATQGQVNSDMEVMKTQIPQLGDPALDSGQMLSMGITNQVTKASETVKIPSLLYGDKVINGDTKFVDMIKRLAGGGTVTIFQVLDKPKCLLRVSTNVMKLNGKRAVGTYIPSSSPVYKTVMSGDTFKGKAYVVNAWYSTAYFPLKDADGKIVTVVYVGRKILNDKTARVIENTNLYEQGYAFIFNDKGEIIYHPKKDLIRKTLDEAGVDQGLFLSANKEIIDYNFEGEHKFAVIEILDSALGWKIGLSLSDAEMLHGLDAKIFMDGLIGALIALAVTLVVVFFFSRGIIKPITSLQQAAQKTADGDFEAISHLPERGDEIGMLQKILQSMVDRLKEKIEEADAISNSCKLESDNAQKAMQEAEQARRDANRAARDAKLQAADTLSDVVNAINTTGESLSRMIDESSSNTQMQKERAAETSNSMSEMNHTVLEVASRASNASQGSDDAKEKAQEGQKIVTDVIGAIEAVNEQTQTMRDGMNSLGEKAEGIGQIMNVITDIADQTNLLALNAAIEAARAGEAGRGFAVVADEVRKLAEKTMQATKEVGDAVRAIQDGTRTNITDMDKASEAVVNSTGLANQAGQALNDIVSTVDETSDQVRSIATAAEEQSAASEEINSSVEEIDRISSETDHAMGEAKDEVMNLMNETRRLQQLIKTLTDEAS